MHDARGLAFLSAASALPRHVEEEGVLLAVLEPTPSLPIDLAEAVRLQPDVREAARVVVQVPLPVLLQIADKMAAVEHDHRCESP